MLAVHIALAGVNVQHPPLAVLSTQRTSKHFHGVMVRPYASSSQVSISVPNCVDNLLVMWVCSAEQARFIVTWGFDIRFIWFSAMRRLNEQMCPLSNQMSNSFYLSCFQ